MKCPHCKDHNLVMSERQGVEIDYCPECRGIWLDRGELDKILEKSRQEAASREPQPAPQPQSGRDRDRDSDYDRDRDYHHKPYKRKKSFLEELFD
jgi:uncharacterized protein